MSVFFNNKYIYNHEDKDIHKISLHEQNTIDEYKKTHKITKNS
jgi:hypothetical protein